MSDRSIVNEYNETYVSNYTSVNPYYDLAATDLRMYLGDQWNAQDKKALKDEGRSAWVFNLIRKNINMVDGYQRSHRLSSIVLPQQKEDQEGADELSDLVMYVFQYGNGYKALSDSFSGAIKTGWNLATVWMDYRDDPINGDIKFGREPFSGFITDPYMTELDLSNCSNVIRRKYITPEAAMSLLPKSKKDIQMIHNEGWSRDDKFTWLPYQRQPSGENYIAYNEFYRPCWDSTDMLVNRDNGQFYEWEGTREEIKNIVDQYPQAAIIKKQKKSIKCDIILNNTFIKTEKNQFGLDEYPFTPLVGLWESESDSWSLKLQSLTRCMNDPQHESNRRLSQMTDMIDSQQNSGWIGEENCVKNPKSLFQTGNGRVVWKKKDSYLEKIPPAQIPPSFFQLQEVYAKGMSEILGINDSAFGVPESANESGIMMMLRQGASITNLQGVFDNLRSAQKSLTIKVLKLIQTWTPEKVERILGRPPTQQFYSKDFIKYDVSVQEGMLTDTQRQMHFRQVSDIYQLTGGPGVSPITASMLIQKAPIQGGAELQKQIEENEQQAQQQQQQQQQIEQQVLKTQMENVQASSVEKMMGAKERFTRSVANMGLEDERASAAIEDRADAALARARAMKELESMGDDRVLKYLQIVQMMEQWSGAQENQIKSNDISISDQIGADAPSGNRLASGMEQAQQNQNTEVTNEI